MSIFLSTAPIFSDAIKIQIARSNYSLVQPETHRIDMEILLYENSE